MHSAALKADALSLPARRGQGQAVARRAGRVPQRPHCAFAAEASKCLQNTARLPLPCYPAERLPRCVHAQTHACVRCMGVLGVR